MILLIWIKSLPIDEWISHNYFFWGDYEHDHFTFFGTSWFISCPCIHAHIYHHTCKHTCTQSDSSSFAFFCLIPWTTYTETRWFRFWAFLWTIEFMIPYIIDNSWNIAFSVLGRASFFLRTTLLSSSFARSSKMRRKMPLYSSRLQPCPWQLDPSEFRWTHSYLWPRDPWWDFEVAPRVRKSHSRLRYFGRTK